MSVLLVLFWVVIFVLSVCLFLVIGSAHVVYV